MHNLATFILRTVNNKSLLVFIAVLSVLLGDMPPVGG